ncbi:MAG: hypothetical protein KBD06_04630 [Candidatus Pacebacteria bacterium]|nr:hypothetical protein [Candidatus Paceibacterota bacterium]
MKLVIHNGQAFEKVSTSRCGKQTLLRPTAMPLKAVVALLTAARELPDIKEVIKSALPNRSEAADTHPTLGPIPRKEQPVAVSGRNVACGVGSYGPRNLVRQSLRQIAR